MRGSLAMRSTTAGLAGHEHPPRPVPPVPSPAASSPHPLSPCSQLYLSLATAMHGRGRMVVDPRGGKGGEYFSHLVCVAEKRPVLRCLGSRANMELRVPAKPMSRRVSASSSTRISSSADRSEIERRRRRQRWWWCRWHGWGSTEAANREFKSNLRSHNSIKKETNPYIYNSNNTGH